MMSYTTFFLPRLIYMRSISPYVYKGEIVRFRLISFYSQIMMLSQSFRAAINLSNAA